MANRKDESSNSKKNKEYLGLGESTFTLQNHWTINLKFQKRINSAPILSELNILKDSFLKSRGCLDLKLNYQPF